MGAKEKKTTKRKDKMGTLRIESTPSWTFKEILQVFNLYVKLNIPPSPSTRETVTAKTLT